jgi:glycosyltransferase involved in cell wall biosynthesis
MSILFLTRSYHPNIGGVEKHIEKISEVLLKQGHEITIISETPSMSDSNDYQSNSSTDNLIVNKNIRIIYIKAGKHDWFKKFRIWKELIFKFALILQADIVHAHDVYFWYLPFRFLLPFKKSFVTFHGYEGNRLPTRRSIFMHKISEVLSNGNICIGKFLVKWYGTDADIISYGAVDKRYLKQNGKFNAKYKKGLYIGRLELETGILEYLKAIKVLKDKGIKVSVDVLGEGSLGNAAREFARVNDLPISFRGFIQNVEKILPEYSFAFVSRYLGILEALAFRLPIIAHYNNAIKKDYLEMTPFSKFIKIAGSKEEIAKGLEEILGRSNKENTDGYEWVKNNTWEEMVSLYLELWNKNY